MAFINISPRNCGVYSRAALGTDNRIERKKPYYYLCKSEKNSVDDPGSARRFFLKPFFLIGENVFQSFRTKVPSSFYVKSLVFGYCL